MKDYYKILEVEPTATIERIKAQYLFLTHAWHPDKFPGGDLKSKAEEKIKEVNEAYDVLGNPAKREIYDQALRSYSSPVAASQSSEGAFHTQSRQYCENCGASAETKYVEFYENVGLILMRHHRSIKGKLCRSCIDYFFWHFTGKTMLLGWWGVISFISTPFILLNNLLRFIFTLGMQKPLLQIAPSPSPIWLLSTIGGFFLLGYYFLSIASSVSSQPTYANPPTTVSSNVSLNPTAPPSIPTRTPTKIKTPTPAFDCMLWSEVSATMIGRDTCIYGNVYKTRYVGETTFQVLFTDDPSAFFLAAGTYYYEVSPGDCIVAEGEILRSAVGVPYIDINEALYHCEAWME